MKKQFLQIVTCCCLIVFASRVEAQQLAVKALKDFPASVIYKVYDVNLKANLTQQQQIEMAKQYQKEEELLAKAILKGASNDEVDLIKAKMLKNFNQLFSEEQLTANYSGVGGRYYTIYAQHQELSLSSQQQDTLLQRMANYSAFKTNFEKKNPKTALKLFISEDLKRILGQAQFEKALAIQYKTQAENWSLKKWTEVEDLGLSSKYDSVSTVNELYTYSLNKLIATENLMGDLKQQKAVLRNMVSTKPKVLKELEFARMRNIKPQVVEKKSFAW